MPEDKGPRVVGLPPLYFLGAAALGWAADPLLPALAPRRPLGACLIAAALALALWAARTLRAAKTTVSVRRAAARLVTGGPFRFSRNPIYLAFTLLTAGVGLAAGKGGVLLALLGVLPLVQRGAIVLEERHLEERFGERYLRYRRSVRRWL